MPNKPSEANESVNAYEVYKVELFALRAVLKAQAHAIRSYLYESHALQFMSTEKFNELADLLGCMDDLINDITNNTESFYAHEPSSFNHDSVAELLGDSFNAYEGILGTLKGRIKKFLDEAVAAYKNQENLPTLRK